MAGYIENPRRVTSEIPNTVDVGQAEPVAQAIEEAVRFTRARVEVIANRISEIDIERDALCRESSRLQDFLCAWDGPKAMEAAQVGGYNPRYR